MKRWYKLREKNSKVKEYVVLFNLDNNSYLSDHLGAIIFGFTKDWTKAFTFSTHEEAKSFLNKQSEQIKTDLNSVNWTTRRVLKLE